MTSFDYLVLAVLAVSALLGFMRGLIKEVLSLVAYAVAFMAAVWWGARVSGWLEPWVENTLLRTGLAYGVVFICVLLLVGLINITLATLVERTGLTPADNGMGALFGLARGLLIILVLVSLGGYTDLPAEPWWRDAAFSPLIIQAIQQIKPALPPTIGAWLPY
ncbi:MAG: CvpA family protein [Alcaligenaceae bacterium]|nr:CvpA family protein [Alcaligenaceae bacterium]